MLPCTFVVVGAVLGLGPASDGADDAAGLRERVDALEARIARLEAAPQPDRWLTQRRAAEIRGLVTDILADADNRAAELDQSLTGGWNEHFFIRSEDGSFLMQALGVVQTRFMLSHRNNSGVDNDRWGFEASRVRLKAVGHVVDPSWHFFVQVELARSPGLRDAFIRKDLGGGWYVRVGQFKLPFTREKLVTFTKTLAVDRSLVDRAYSVGRSAGLELDYISKQWRLRANVNNGARALNVGALSTGTDFAFAARAETVVLGGTWKQFSELRGPRAAHDGALIGAAIFYQKNNASAADPNDERFAVTADVLTELRHMDVFASFIWNQVDPGAPGSPSMSQLGAVIQGGVRLTDNWELFARYEWSDFDSAGVADLSVVTVGVVRYYNGNSLKWTTDVGVGLNPVASVFAAPSLGWQVDAPGENGQVVVRSQLQLLF
jgi:hypothetical protein